MPAKKRTIRIHEDTDLWSNNHCGSIRGAYSQMVNSILRAEMMVGDIGERINENPKDRWDADVAEYR